MLTLTRHVSTLAHLALYAERHGKDRKKGWALRLQTTVPSEALDAIEKGLKGALYKGEALRFPHVDPIHSRRELIGARLLLDCSDLLGKRRIELDGAAVDRFVLTPYDGGSVGLTFRAKITELDGEEVARLYELVYREDVEVTLDPAKATEQTMGERQGELETEGAE